MARLAVPGSHLLQIGAALAILGLRAYFRPLAELWCDWIVILALYWIFDLLARGTRAWTVGTAVATGALLGVYAIRQVPFTLAIWGLGPPDS